MTKNFVFMFNILYIAVKDEQFSGGPILDLNA